MPTPALPPPPPPRTNLLFPGAIPNLPEFQPSLLPCITTLRHPLNPSLRLPSTPRSPPPPSLRAPLARSGVACSALWSPARDIILRGTIFHSIAPLSSEDFWRVNRPSKALQHYPIQPGFLFPCTHWLLAGVLQCHEMTERRYQVPSPSPDVPYFYRGYPSSDGATLSIS